MHLVLLAGVGGRAVRLCVRRVADSGAEAKTQERQQRSAQAGLA